MIAGAAGHVLIAAVSGRALAQAARRDGYIPLVADLFGDDDTRLAAEAVETLPGGLRHGIRRASLARALARLANGRAPIGLVCGSGFESRPELLAWLARRYRLVGNPADVVRTVKNPLQLSELCQRADIPHPEIRLHPAPAPGWLVKRIGGAGGAHVRPARPGRKLGARRYVQRRVSGMPVSALFVADGRACRMIGFSTQWVAPLKRRPFRYGGAARPALLSPAAEDDLTRSVKRLASEAGLVGLNSADFLVADQGLHLLEVNPRPGATVDVFATPGLFQLHVAACGGKLPDALPALTGGAAAAIAYARRPICLAPGFPWPGWAADRQPAGVPVPAHAPLCTVRAEAADSEAARRLVEQRLDMILALAEEAR